MKEGKGVYGGKLISVVGGSLPVEREIVACWLVAIQSVGFFMTHYVLKLDVNTTQGQWKQLFRQKRTPTPPGSLVCAWTMDQGDMTWQTNS